MYKSMLHGFLFLLATTIVIILAYYATVIIGKKANKLLDNRYTKVLEKTTIGANTSIMILKINQRIYIIVMQGKTIRLLDIIDEEDWKFLDNDIFRSNKKYVNNNFITNRLFNFNKKKKGSEGKIHSWNGSDNNE